MYKISGELTFENDGEWAGKMYLTWEVDELVEESFKGIEALIAMSLAEHQILRTKEIIFHLKEEK